MKNYSMLKRIGGTTYQVKVHVNDTGQESMQDKILRMIRNDMDMGKWDCTNDEIFGIINLPQMSRPA